MKRTAGLPVEVRPASIPYPTKMPPENGLVPNESQGVVRWLKEGSPELPGKFDDRKPTVVLLPDFAAYEEFGVEPADFDQWRGSKFSGLGWLERSADGAGWLDGFYRMAYIIDSSRVVQKGSGDDKQR